MFVEALFFKEGPYVCGVYVLLARRIAQSCYEVGSLYKKTESHIGSTGLSAKNKKVSWVLLGPGVG